MIDFGKESLALESKTPAERLARAVELFPGRDELLFTSSFGAGSAVLLHLWSEVARHLPVVFLDTGLQQPVGLMQPGQFALVTGLYTGFREASGPADPFPASTTNFTSVRASWMFPFMWSA